MDFSLYRLYRLSLHIHFLFLKKDTITAAPRTMIPSIAQNPQDSLTSGVPLAWIPNKAATKLSGKVITEIIVRVFITWFVRRPSNDSFASCKALMLSF